MGLGPFGASKKNRGGGEPEVPGDAIARVLARRLDESGQPAATRVTVAELHRVLLPYHECRDALGLATKAEYDVALLRFLESGAYVRINETGLAEAVEEELASPEPGLAFLKNFAAAQLHLRRTALPAPGPEGGEAAATDGAAAVEPGADDWLEELDRPDSPTGDNGSATAEEPVGGSGPPAAPEPVAGPEPVASGVTCRACREPLPGRPGLRFCPGCGADQRVARCGRCGEELEGGWAFCPRCGSAADGG